MSEVYKEEADKCKTIAQSALAAGDAEKATRFLQKAKRMCPNDVSIDSLLAQVSFGNFCGASASGGSSANQRSSADGPRYRGTCGTGTTDSASTPGATRADKDVRNYSSEQMQFVQRILRTQDYYAILEVERDAREDAIKKAYKKLALKLHPDKNKAPGAEEAFKKLSKAAQCLTDQEKKQVYDRYGDEDRIPTQHRQAYQQDFMTPEDLFSAFFGGGSFHSTFRQQPSNRANGSSEPAPQVQGANFMQILPILFLVLLTLASNFGSNESSRFSFTLTNQYRNERTTPTLSVNYYVMDEFDDSYPEGTRSLATFEDQVDVYYARTVHSECDKQQKHMDKKVMLSKRRGTEEEVQEARKTPRPKCKELEKIKQKHMSIFRSAMYMGG